MTTTGSRIYFTLAALLFGIAVLYGIATNTADAGILGTLTGNGVVDAVLGPLTFGYKGGVGDHYGYAILMGSAGVALSFGAVHQAFFDGNTDMAPEAALDAKPASRPLIADTPWPLLAGLSFALLVVGLAISSAVFVIGVIASIICGLEWLFTAWSDQVSDDAEANHLLRDRIMGPLELVVGTAVVALGSAFAISRLFLASSKIVAAVLAIVIAAVVTAVAFLTSSKPRLDRKTLTGLVVVVFVGIIGAGIGGAVAGTAPEQHEDEAPAEEGSRAPIDLSTDLLVHAEGN